MIQKGEGIYLISDESEKETIRTQEWVGLSGIFGGPALVPPFWNPFFWVSSNHKNKDSIETVAKEYNVEAMAKTKGGQGKMKREIRTAPF